MYGLEKLIEKLFEWLEDLLPFVVIPHYDMGVRLRFGIPKGPLDPGLHWKIPFVDQILTSLVNSTTLNLTEQSITTKDGVSCVARVALKFESEDIETLLREVNSPQEALVDMAGGLVYDKVSARTWAECLESSLLTDISRNIKIESKKWGIKVQSVVITDLSAMRSFRILNTATK